jgi:hypothetical protein
MVVVVVVVVVKIDVPGYHNLAGLLILFGSSIGFRGEEDKPALNPEKLSDIMDCIEHFTSLSTELCMSLCSLTMCI